ncbi:MAG: hypothetical protein MJ231_09280, partial [bacterium]|nr:hypothetical protein [bacterium]
MKINKTKKVLPLIICVTGIIVFALIFILRLNIMTLAAAVYMCIVSAIILLGILTKKTLYIFDVIGYGTAGVGIILYDIIFGADAGFGA